MKLSIIIPVFNELSTIRQVIDEVNRVAVDKEVIVVDDGSTDGTAEEVSRLEDSVARVYHSPVNFGKGAAIRVGLTYITGDVVVIQDADGELNPNEYHLLLSRIKAGADVVYGSRFLTPNPNISRINRLANRFLTILTNLLYGCRLTDMETAYKMFRTEVARKLRLKCIGFEVEPELTAQFLKLGYRIDEVPISYRPRTQEEGKKITWRDGVRAIYYLLFYRFFR
ncbi:MAG: glycosyltransferase family 2 protein [Candidatus Glassbacteria bacterium]